MNGSGGEIDLNARWEETCASFANTAQGKSLKRSPIPTPEQVVEAIRRKGKDSKKPDKWEKLGTVVGNVGFALLQFGEVASQAASMFFGPSQICMNAVSFFVDAAVRYKKIFDSLDELFQRIGDALNRVDVYRKNQGVIDEEMKHRANLILLAFTNVCDLSYKVLVKHSKVWQFTKSLLFKDDDGVQAALDDLDKLTKEEAEMRSTLTYVSGKRTEKTVERTEQTVARTDKTVERTGKVVEETAEAVVQLFESSKKAEIKDERDKWFKSIEQKLSLEHDSSHETNRRFYLESAIEGSGLWVEQLDAFNSWANLDQARQDLLVLSGEGGSGKTVLVSKVVDILQQRFSRKGDELTKVFVACYFFGGPNKRDNKNPSQVPNKDGRTVGAALRTLALQVAYNDEVYCKNLQSTLSDSANLPTDIGGLWETLFVKSNSLASFFLIFDDFHELEDKASMPKLLNAIAEQSKNTPRIRVLLSGRVDSDQLKEKLKELNLSQSIIDVASSNKDIAKYVEGEVTRMPLLKGPTTESLRQEICKTLGALPSFSGVKGWLEEIATKQRPEEIQEVLKKAEAGDNMIFDRLERCNQLPDDYIQQLNQLLEWVMCTYYPLSLRELQAVLHIRKPYTVLTPLRKRIHDEFNLLSVAGAKDEESLDSEVSLVSESLKEHFKDSTEREQQESSLSDNIITEMEVKIVQRFLKNLCDEDLYAKFKFQDFFDKKLKGTAKVHVNTEEMHAKVALDCLKVMLRETGEASWLVKDYADYYWLDHLEQPDISLVNQTLRMEIGQRLIPMFIEEEGMEKWTRASWLGFAFLCEDKFTISLLKWIQDSAVNKRSSSEYKEWIKQLSDPTSNDHEQLWKRTIRFMIKKWLFEAGNAEDDLLEPFRWVRAFINKLNCRRDPNEKRLKVQAYYSDEMEPEEIQATADFAREELEVASLSYSSQCRLAETFLRYKNYEEAKDTYTAATSLQEDNWEAYRGLARTSEGLKEWEAAIEYMRPVVDKLEKDPASVKDGEIKLRDCLRQIADWHRSLQSYGDAMQIYEKLLKVKPGDYETICDVLTLLNVQGKDAELVHYLETLKVQTDEESGHDRLSQMIIELAQQEEKHHMIVQTAKHANYLQPIKETYRKAIRLAQAKREEAQKEAEIQAVLTLANLYLHAASSLHRHHDSDEEKLEAISFLQEVVELKWSPESQDTFSVVSAQKAAVVRLCLHYLAQAQAAPPDSDVASSNLAKMKKLCSTDESQRYEYTYLIDRDDSQAFLGHYYASRNDKDKAMKELKPRIASGIEMLSDHEPDNDWFAFYKLGDGLLRYKDDENALAAFSLIAPTENLPTVHLDNDSNNQINPPAVSLTTSAHPSETGPAATSSPPLENGISSTTKSDNTVPETESLDGVEKPKLKRSGTSRVAKRPTGPMSFFCDGNCSTQWTYADDIYFCRQCPYTWLDEGCLDKMRKGELPRHFCDPSHEYFHVPKWDFLKAARVGEGNVMVGERIVKTRDWLDGIREQWDLPKTEDPLDFEAKKEEDNKPETEEQKAGA